MLFFIMVSKSNEIFLTPDYIANFKCIGKNCIDSCCIDWNIEIDKETFKCYTNSSDERFNPISKNYVTLVSLFY